VKVQYYGRLPTGYGNIVFPHAWPMRSGKFQKPHPCHENPNPVVFSRAGQPLSDDPLGKFRALGYMASCFPEGDGIAFDPPAGRASPQVVQDIKDCFGWEVEVERP
jgi:hypothetical protein